MYNKLLLPILSVFPDEHSFRPALRGQLLAGSSIILTNSSVISEGQIAIAGQLSVRSVSKIISNLDLLGAAISGSSIILSKSQLLAALSGLSDVVNFTLHINQSSPNILHINQDLDKILHINQTDAFTLER